MRYDVRKVSKVFCSLSQQDRMNVQRKAKSVLCRSGTGPEVVDKPTSNGKESKIAESKPVGEYSWNSMKINM